MSFFIVSSPKIYFFDQEGKITAGNVFLDSDFIGDILDKGYIKLPKDACKTDHIIKLVIGDKEHEFSFYPIDCNYKSLNFTVSEGYVQIEKRPESVTLKFIITETQESLEGSLYFDDIYSADIEGPITLDREKCAGINKITLFTQDVNVSWDNSPVSCEEKDVLEFPVEQSQFT